MALPAAQYRTFRSLLSIQLSVEGQPVNDATTLAFFKQVLADSSGATAPSTVRLFLMGEIFRRILSGDSSNPSDADVASFWTQYATDANAGSAMGQTTQYRLMRNALLGALTCDSLNPTDADLSGYFLTYGGFSGNFGALFTGVLQYLRSDLGITTDGTGITAWADQSGAGVNVTPSLGATYIGIAGPGLLSRASVIADGSTQGGQYTLALPGASAGTPTFMWAVWRLLGATNTPSRIFSDQNASLGLFVNNGTTQLYAQGNSVIGPVTTAIGTWGRMEAQFSNQASDYVKFGSGVATGASGNTAPNPLRGIFCTNLSSGRINAELLCYITLNNIPTAPQLAAASAAVTAFYGGTVTV